MGKFKMSYTKADLTIPNDPMVRIEEALNCDGSECEWGRLYTEDELETQLEIRPPHWHLVESQPGACTILHQIDRRSTGWVPY